MIHSTKARYLVAFEMKLGVDGAERMGVGGSLVPVDQLGLGESGICPPGEVLKY